MKTTTWPNMRAIREELHLSQVEMAAMLGVSPRVVQSCEQGWRSLGSSVEKSLLLALMIHRHGRALAEFRCWDVMQCSTEQREKCITYRSGQGSLCWFLFGNQCSGKNMGSWTAKKSICHACKFFRRLLPDGGDPA